MSRPELIVGDRTDTSSESAERKRVYVQLERFELRAPVWPVGRLPSILAWASLILVLWSSMALTAAPSLERFLALIPATLAALMTRLVVEVLADDVGDSEVRPKVSAPLVGAVVGGGLSVAIAIVLGLQVSSPGVATAIVGTALVLFAARRLRSFELHLGASNRTIFFIGSRDQSKDFAREIRRRGGMRLVGHVHHPSLHGTSESASELARIVMQKQASTLVLSSDAIRNETFVAAASELNLQGVRVRMLNDFYEEQFAKVPLSELSPSWFLFDVAEIHRARPYGLAKRVLETAVAAIVLLITLPLIIGVAIAIRLTDSGPVLYRQWRVGKDGARFLLTKFRTMRPEHGARPGWIVDDRDRVTPVGRVLRRFRLDELPQLWHVIRGDLSLVGPRPEQPHIVDQLERKMEYYAARHSIRPGVTGWAQINYGYGGSDAGVLEKLQFDFYYIKRQSLRLDLAIIASTVRIVAMGKGS